MEGLIDPETAGSPTSEAKWVRSSLRHLSQRLGEAGYRASPPTVRRLLRERHYALRKNRKTQEAGADHPDRNRQFGYLQQQKEVFEDAGWPIISVDAKKKELIGEFFNAGHSWCQKAIPVNVHDFLSQSQGRAVPYGIYDVSHNRGSVWVGSSADTPQFAVEAIAAWWEQEGQPAYPDTDQLLILADGGGSNGYRCRGWKHHLQTLLCDRFGLTVTVCHYPTGCSKWNPIEHRLFGPISMNWAGKPLTSWDTMLAYIRGTTTTTGLTVRATRLDGVYETGQKVSDEEMEALVLTPHAVCPPWNYTLSPRGSDSSVAPGKPSSGS